MASFKGDELTMPSAALPRQTVFSLLKKVPQRVPATGERVLGQQALSFTPGKGGRPGFVEVGRPEWAHSLV